MRNYHDGSHDYVAQTPQPILEYRESGGDEREVVVEKGFVAAIQEKKYFIHCAATLPIKEFESDLGFGLWVEVSRDDFFRYYKAQEDDNLYREFECKGILANDWPLFPGTCGDDVFIKVVSLHSKIRIVNIESSDVELPKYTEKDSLTPHQKDILRKRIKDFYLHKKYK